MAGTAVDDLQPHVAMPGGMEMLGSLLLVCAYASRGLKRLDDSRARAGETVEHVYRFADDLVCDMEIRK